MDKLSIKERIVFGFIFNEKRVYQHWYTRFLACGVAAGLMVITKLVGLLALSGLVVVCGLTFWEKRMSLKEGMLVILGWTLPLIAWELVQFLTLTLRFDFQTYQGYKGQFFGFFLKGGSGLDAENAGGLAFVWQKLLVVKEISLFNDVIGFIVFLSVQIFLHFW